MRLRRSTLTSLAVLSVIALVAPQPLSSGLFSKKKKPTPNLYRLPDAVADIPSAAFVPASRPCPNWAWGAVVESLARAHGVELKQQNIVVKAYGGNLCTRDFSVSDLDRFDAYVTGDYTTDDQRKIHIEAVLHPGVPESIEPLILAAQQKRPILIMWHDRIFQLKGVSYAAFVAPDGSREYQATEIRLADPLNAFPGEAAVTLREDDAAGRDFQAWMDLRISDRLF